MMDSNTRNLTRRQMLATAATAAAVFASPSMARMASRKRPVLRVLGTHVTLQESIRRAAQSDLGIDVEFTPGGSATVLQQASTRPESFDVYEQWSNSIDVLWLSDAIKPIHTSQIDRWAEVNALAKTGRLHSSDTIAAGDAPNSLLYVQPDGTLGPKLSSQVSFLPYVHNVDSFAYNTRHHPIGKSYEEESWGWMLDPEMSGRVAFVNEPTIGLFDAALAAQAQGMITFEDIGNMTIAEIDQLVDILIDHARGGHFAGFWNSVPESVQFMQSGRTTIQSMFSPGVASLRAAGVPVRYAAPKEGYRAWHGVMCMSSAISSDVEELAYQYMNWWLSGRAGAMMCRQGYYISIPDAARPHLTQSEWDYWYDGLPASEDITGPDGRTIARAGESRNGGSYANRFSNIAVWNTVMDNYEYSLVRWGELLSTERKQSGSFLRNG